MLLAIFVSGAIMMASLVAGLFFFRFWKSTADRLFFLFGLSFWVMAVERWVLVLVDPTHELKPYIYLMRMTAYIIILIAIIDKNRKRSRTI